MNSVCVCVAALALPLCQIRKLIYVVLFYLLLIYPIVYFHCGLAPPDGYGCQALICFSLGFHSTSPCIAFYVIV